MSPSLFVRDSKEIIQYLNGIHDGIESRKDFDLIKGIDIYSKKINEILQELNNNGRKIFFVRHGETDRNKQKIMNPGDYDSPLNNLGVAQAEFAGEQMLQQGNTIQYIGTSDLQRASRTSQIIADLSNNCKNITKTVKFYELREMFGGNFIHTPVKELENILETDNTELLRKFYKSKKYNGIESTVEFDYRVTKAFYDYLLVYQYGDGNMLIGGHSGTSRVVRRIIEGGGLEENHYRGGSISNSVVYELDTRRKKLQQITQKLKN